MLESALALAAAGFRVFPLHGKSPIEGSHGSKDATRDPAVIKRWWTLYNDANVAIATGQGLIVLDVDTKQGRDGFGSLNALFPDGHPETLAVRTGSGGLHFYFRAPPGILNSNDLLAPGLDIRGEGGYVVAPPSVHPDTHRAYEWVTAGALITPAPLVLLTRLADARPEPVALSGAITANRNTTLTSMAGVLRANGASDSEVLHGLLALNASRCQPPLPPEEVQRIARNATRWEQGPPLITEVEDLSAESTTSTQDTAGTDRQNAARFFKLHGQDLRFHTAQKAWYVWRETHWEENNPEAMELAKTVADSFRAEAPDTRAAQAAVKAAVGSALTPGAAPADTSEMRERLESLQGKREHLLKLAANLEQVPTLERMLTSLRTAPSIRVNALDSDQWLLSLANGVLDLREGQLRAHQRSDLITRVLPVRWDPTAEAPLWERFLQRVVPDPELRGYLKRAVGYTLTGSTREQTSFFLYGDGKNGKSTFIEVLMELLGTYAATGAERLLESGDRHPEELAALEGRRMVLLSEMSSRALGTDRIKRLVSGEQIRARRMGTNSWSFSPTFKLWLTGNNKPTIRETDGGIWRRLKLVPFEQVISEAERDRDIKAKLLRELPGILRWCAQGCVEWQQEGLQEPQAVREATEDYRQEQDTIGTFLLGLAFVPEASTGSAALYQRFQVWTKDNGFDSRNATWFGLEMKRFATRHPELGLTRHKTMGAMVWRGVSLTAPPGAQIRS